MTYNDITQNEKAISGALALVMHLLFLVLLVFGVSWQKKQADSVAIIDLWSNLPAPQPQAETPPPPEAKPPPEPLPKVEARPAPQPETKPAVKPDIALKEKLEKERKQKEQEKLEAKKREAEKARLAALKEKQAKEADAKRLAREQDDALRKLAQQQAAAQAKLMNEYTDRISAKIRRFIVEPPNLQGNPEVQFEVVQLPGGEVLSVKLRRTSGVPAYDNAVERAILKAQPLPPPPQGVAFNDVRELILKIRPKQ